MGIYLQSSKKTTAVQDPKFQVKSSDYNISQFFTNKDESQNEMSYNFCSFPCG